MISSSSVCFNFSALYDSDDDEELKIPEIPSVELQKIVVTTDNAANITKAITDSDMNHIICFAHTLNLSVQSFCEAISNQLMNMRAVIKFFNKHPRMIKKLKVR